MQLILETTLVPDWLVPQRLNYLLQFATVKYIICSTTHHLSTLENGPFFYRKGTYHLS
jgi:hypothetical protein